MTEMLEFSMKLEKTTKNFAVYKAENEAIVGSLYLPQSMLPRPFPARIMADLRPSPPLERTPRPEE